jgi:DNA-binding response OmpR family regulator
MKIQVSDTGCGITEEDLSHIFERFYQGNNTNLSTGSGIGLHLVNEYVKLHKGSIDVKSQLGKGSIFTIELPLNIYYTEQENKDIKQKSRTNTLKILIAEDNFEFSRFLYNELSEKYHVILAYNGKEGLTKVREEQPDLVISDIMMPEMSGTEFCDQLKNDMHISHIPVILITARTSEDIQFEGFKAKADAYITKPFSMDILLLRIQNLIEQQEKRKELYKNAIVLNPSNITTTDIDRELIKKAILLIDQNLDDSTYSVEKLSNDMFMDRTSLYRKLQVIVGQTPSEFIRSIRLKKAAFLLERGDSVNQVSDKVGFGTTSYFIKCFQKEFGVRPSQYKKSH